MLLMKNRNYSFNDNLVFIKCIHEWYIDRKTRSFK